MCWFGFQHILGIINMSHVTRKPVFGVFDQVILKPAYSHTETSQRLEIYAIASRGIILSRQRTTKVLIRLELCAGGSAPLLFAYCKTGFLMTGFIYNAATCDCHISFQSSNSLLMKIARRWL